jgi:phospholipase D-like protein
MLLSGTLFALFMMGFWLYCLTDAILTPASECRGLSKAAWIAVITLTFVGGAIAWLIAREPQRNPAVGASPARSARWDPDDPGDPEDLEDPDAGHFRSWRWTAADDALARHPAGRSRMTGTGRAGPKGPDDDPEFLRALDRAIRDNSLARDS